MEISFFFFVLEDSRAERCDLCENPFVCFGTVFEAEKVFILEINLEGYTPSSVWKGIILAPLGPGPGEMFFSFMEK